MDIQKLKPSEAPPMDLLFLADPSREFIEKYLSSGQCYVANSNSKIIGVYVLLPTKTKTIELINIAVKESEHGNGIGKQLVNHAIETARSKGMT